MTMLAVVCPLSSFICLHARLIFSPSRLNSSLARLVSYNSGTEVAAPLYGYIFQ